MRRVLELAPASWQQTLEDPEVQRRLEANIFRRILLVDPAALAKPAAAAAQLPHPQAQIAPVLPTRFTKRIQINETRSATSCVRDCAPGYQADNRRPALTVRTTYRNRVGRCERQARGIQPITTETESLIIRSRGELQLFDVT